MASYFPVLKDMFQTLTVPNEICFESILLHFVMKMLSINPKSKPTSPVRENPVSATVSSLLNHKIFRSHQTAWKYQQAMISYKFVQNRKPLLELQ